MQNSVRAGAERKYMEEKMTAKRLAKTLGVSEATVSFALNNKPGVSTRTRNRIREAARQYGMDVERLSDTRSALQTVYLVYFRKHGAILADTTFFSELTEGVENTCLAAKAAIRVANVYDTQELERVLSDLRAEKNAGAVIFGTEMQGTDFALLREIRYPFVLMDNHCTGLPGDSVQIANIDGAFLATDYLVKKRKVQPGYLHSAYRIFNFDERRRGFEDALHENGMSRSRSPVIELTPSAEGAYEDMKAYLDAGEEVSSAYFADNDLIAIGAIRALKEKGYRVPEDIGVIGFDDIPLCDYINPPLTTVHIPKRYMGSVAARRLFERFEEKGCEPLNLEIQPSLVVRGSV